MVTQRGNEDGVVLRDVEDIVVLAGRDRLAVDGKCNHRYRFFRGLVRWTALKVHWS